MFGTGPVSHGKTSIAWGLGVALAALSTLDGGVAADSLVAQALKVRELDAELQRQAQEDLLSFSPWHGLAAHRPLGGVNRARKETYEFSAGFRGDFNKCPVHSVKMLEDLPA